MRRVFWCLTGLLGIVGLFLSVPFPTEASGSGSPITTSDTTPSGTCPTATTTHYATLAAFTTCPSTTTTVYAPATTETCATATTVTMTPTLAAFSTCPPRSTTVWANAVTNTTTPGPTSTTPTQTALDVPGGSMLASLLALAFVGSWLSSRNQ